MEPGRRVAAWVRYGAVAAGGNGSQHAPGSEENPSGAGVSPCAAEADASRAEAEAIDAVAEDRLLSGPA